MRVVLSFFSGVSFIFFGLACFYNSLFVNEFYRYGLSEYRTIIGFFQLLGGIGSIIGVFDKRILIISSLGLSVMMLLGVGVRIKINDTFIQTLPALTYLIVNAIICIDVVTKAKK
ncbi:MAG: hypothetical protein P8N91_04165 [Flavobacteriaceae bacterium]|jgi:uncharacterized membrane protein HdeD (DUF308 family)|nr:hypothetical protein [Flavobacteriaceae bacterium]